MTNYILAQPTSLQDFTIHDTDGELADNMVQFYEKRINQTLYKCRFKTNTILISVKGTDHTVTTAEGKVIHKKVASNSLKVQPSKRSEVTITPINRCRRCVRISHDDYCETRRRLVAESANKVKQQDEASTSKFFSQNVNERTGRAQGAHDYHGQPDHGREKNQHIMRKTTRRRAKEQRRMR